MNATTSRRRWWARLLILLLVAFALRVARLTEVPPGLSHDEASNGHDSAAILRGVHRIYFPVGYGHEPLYNYSAALTTSLLGQRIFTLRLTTVAWGWVQLVLVVALARRWWGRTAAVGAAAAYAVSFWALMMARLGLRAPVLPALLSGTVLIYDHALTARTDVGRRVRYVAAGLLLGASFYTYMASRGMPLIFLTLLIVLAMLNRDALRGLWRGTLAMVSTAVLIGLPLFLYLRAHPELEQRVAQLGSALTGARGGDWRPLWRNVAASLPMLLWRGDPRWLYHIGDRPALAPLLGLLFVLGVTVAFYELVQAARQRHDHLPARADLPLVRHLLVLLWLGAGLAPALLVPVDYNTLHAIGAMPAVMLLIALGFDRTCQTLKRRRLSFAVRAAAATVIVVLFAFTGWRTARAYFVTWGRNRDVRVAYHHHVVALGRHLDEAPLTDPVVITSLYPGEVHDPYTMEVTLQREDISLRWVDGRSALFVPSESARLFVEPQTHPPGALWSVIEPDLEPETILSFHDDDIPDEIRGYRWDAPASWARLAASLGQSGWRPAPGQPAPGDAKPETIASATYGGTVSLVGYRTTPEPAAPGTTIEMWTAWQVEASTDRELVLFSHLIDEAGALVAQDDRLDAPSWQWQPSDRFVQIHHLTPPEDLPPGRYAVAVGWFDRTTLDRLPITDESVDNGPITHLWLPLEVRER